MKDILLNFFGEKVLISTPENLSLLRNQISENYGLSETDAGEIILYYMKQKEKISIVNDEDYSNFLQLGISTTLFLEVDKNSSLYLSHLSKLQEEEKQKLIQKKEELEKKKEEYLKSYEEHLNTLNRQLDILQAKKLDLVMNKKKNVEEFDSRIEKIEKKLETLEKEPKLKSRKKNVASFYTFQGILDNIVQKVKDMTNAYIFKKIEGANVEGQKDIENIQKISEDAVEEINNLSKLVIKQSMNLDEFKEDNIKLRGEAKKLGANEQSSELCEDCKNKNEHKNDHLSIRIAGESNAVVYRGVKCNGCGRIIWEN